MVRRRGEKTPVTDALMPLQPHVQRVKDLHFAPIRLVLDTGCLRRRLEKGLAR